MSTITAPYTELVAALRSDADLMRKRGVSVRLNHDEAADVIEDLTAQLDRCQGTCFAALRRLHQVQVEAGLVTESGEAIL